MGMSSRKGTVLLLLLCFLLIHELEMYGGRSWTVEALINCRSRCDCRCSKASRHKMCLRACNTCCERCNCVPPGTTGNTATCPCYAHMTTHGGSLKCP